MHKRLVDGLLPIGALDKQFLTGPPLFTSPNPYVPGSIPGAWVPNSTSSQRSGSKGVKSNSCSL